MKIERLKNIDDLVDNKDVYLGTNLDKPTYDLISRGFVPINLPNPTDRGERTSNNVPILSDEVVMEFTLYDAGNNVLQQKGAGEVRYIKNYSQYLIKSISKIDTTNNNGGWLVDVKTLIREAGYKTGYFRVQISFVRNRIGSDAIYDKLYIQEISATRQEVRLLPFDNYNANSELDFKTKEKLNKNLREEYESFLNGEFPTDEVKDDIDFLKKSLDINTLPFEIERLNPDLAKQIKKEYGVSISYLVRRIISWFHTRDIESFIGKSRQYWNKEQILSLMFAKRFRTLLRTGYLPRRDIKNTARYESFLTPSLDELSAVTQTIQRDNVFRLPPIERKLVTPPIAPAPPMLEPKFTILPIATKVTDTTAFITFANDRNTTAILTFNGNCPTQGCIIRDENSTTRHIFRIEGLSSETTYTVNVTAIATDGQRAQFDGITFNTNPTPLTFTLTDLTQAPSNPYETINTGGSQIFKTSEINPNVVEGSINDLQNIR